MTIWSDYHYLIYFDYYPTITMLFAVPLSYLDGKEAFKTNRHSGRYCPLFLSVCLGFRRVNGQSFEA